MEETYVQSLIRDDPTCDGTTKPSSHNYWTSALGPWSCNYWSLSTLDPVLHHKRSLCKWDTHTLQWRVASARFNWRKPVKQQKPSTAKNKYIVFVFFFKSMGEVERQRKRDRGNFVWAMPRQTREARDHKDTNSDKAALMGSNITITDILKNSPAQLHLCAME